MPFRVELRRADGARRRVDVEAETRFLAARFAERSIAANERCPAVAEAVFLSLQDELLHLAPDEVEGPAAFRVRLADVAPIVLRADSREAAIAAARSRTGGRDVLAVDVRFGCLGRCAFCDSHLFRDMKVRRFGDGFKCADCP